MMMKLHDKVGLATVCMAASAWFAGCGAPRLAPESTASGGSTSGGSPATTGPGILAAAPCLACAEPKCPAEAQACTTTEGCAELVTCMLGCSVTGTGCATQCSGNGSSNANASSAATTYAACAVLACLTTCTPAAAGVGGTGQGGSASSQGGVSNGQGGTANAQGGNPISLGGTSHGLGGTANAQGGNPITLGGAATGQGGTGNAGAGGQTTTALASGINWLTITDDWAAAEDAPNGALNISGAIYAYGDSCATLNWDPVTRCASGVLCTPGATYENWGIAVGFDFHNTGESGSPPNAKLTWNPANLGAVGVAWSLSGSAPGLQVWILNMDPSWNGTCSAESCEIAGPPDGTSAAALQGQLRFDNLVKDDWGGSGTYYVFDPAAIQGLQFKLPAITAGGESFAFCIDRIGIVLP